MTSELIGQAKSFLKLPTQSVGGVGVVGDLALDRFVHGSVDRISPEAPVPVLKVERTEDRLGCAANVVANLMVLNETLPFSTYVMGVVGADDTGDALAERFKALGPKLETFLIKDPSRPTTVKTRMLAGAQHQLLRVDYENSTKLSPALINDLFSRTQSTLSKLKCLVLQDYAKGALTPDFLARILPEAKKAKVFTLIDPNSNTPAEAYRGADLLTPNVTEAEVLLGRSLHKGADDHEMAQACRDLRTKLQLTMCMITRSSHGMTLLDEHDAITHFPACARAVYDVTGAGDTVVAVLAAAIAAGQPMSVACILATAAASVVVGKVGTATATVREILSELDALRTVK